MITIFVGDIRIGKSSLMAAMGIESALNADKKALRDISVRRLKKDGYSVSNDPVALYTDKYFPIDYMDEFGRRVCSIEIDPAKLALNDTGEYIRPHSTILIDEGQYYFSARAWQKFTPEQALFYQTSGHFGIDIFFTCQNLDNIEKQIRELSHVIRVNRRRIIDVKGRETEHAEDYFVKKIIWEYTYWETFRAYDSGKPGVNAKYTINYNVYSVYKSESRYDFYLPHDKKIKIK